MSMLAVRVFVGSSLTISFGLASRDYTFDMSAFMLVAVDCIALSYWGKHKRKMAIRGIN